MKLKITLKQFIIILMAANFIGLGVAFFLKANLGSDSITVLQDGVHNVMHISYGAASRYYNTVLIITALIVARQHIGIGTIISALIVGFLIDFYLGNFSKLFPDPNMIFKVFFLISGNFIYALGLSLLIYFKIGMNSLDSILYAIKEKTKLDYHVLRITADLLVTILGIVLGGIWGLGTLLSVLTTGLIIKMYMQLFEYFNLNSSNPEKENNLVNNSDR